MTATIAPASPVSVAFAAWKKGFDASSAQLTADFRNAAPYTQSTEYSDLLNTAMARHCDECNRLDTEFRKATRP